MVTLFWLAVFIAVCGVGRFILAALIIIFEINWGTWQEQVMTKAFWPNMLPWKWLLVGLGAVVVCITI